MESSNLKNKLVKSHIGQLVLMRQVYYIKNEHFTTWKNSGRSNTNSKILGRTKTVTNCMVLDINKFTDDCSNDVCLVKLFIIPEQIVIWVDGNESNVIEFLS